MRLSFIVGIAVIAGVTGMGVLSASRGHTRLGPFKGESLDPAVYRAPITAVDAVLFEDGTLDEAGRATVRDQLLVLGRLTGTDTTNTIATALAQNARMLSSMAEHQAVGMSIPGSTLQREWMRIRSSLFADASWFRRSSADPVAPAVEGPPPPSPILSVSHEARVNLETALYSMNLEIQRARADIPNPYDSDAHRLYEVDTERELAVDSARIGEPEVRYNVDIYYRRAQEQADMTRRSIRGQARLYNRPEHREELLVEAEGTLAKARAYMAKMQP
jgi:hypothetical protein